MMDRDKVINGLELCGYMEGMPQCDSCPYDGKQCWKRLKNDALALLKAQEPVEPVYELGITRCGQCNHEIDKYGGDNYCPQCGKAVKWE